ncbi:hypothetical protein HPC49_13860 [Pyxidicoccus fallax]|uniref:Protein-arginine deiminase C-terminal domain-containing protein n=1 Tax=Pyxidicoccus fallax TaxID=394095 RepID=A0A848LFP9_9BACT|nr:protein-arginine deiminase family protein [Pyxidicoccus fallax]NMO15923.1 hypothetical protein [Pyxidicoccus fallax]NPC79319.1 hypothetical protein [Pyxidicoccus fallax]
MRFFNAPPQPMAVVVSGGTTNTVPGGNHAVAPTTNQIGNVLQAPALHGLTFMCRASNASTDTVYTANLDQKVQAPGVLVLPRVENSEGNPLTYSVRIFLRAASDSLPSATSADVAEYFRFLSRQDINSFCFDTYSDEDAERFTVQAQFGGQAVTWLSSQAGLVTFGSPAPDWLNVSALIPRGISGRTTNDPPDTERPVLPLEHDGALNTESERRPGELWLRLVHKDDQDNPLAFDVALVTVAPLLFCSNADPVVTLYTVTGAQTLPRWDNTPWVESLEALAQQTGVPLVRLQPRTADAWARDQVLLGYWCIPERAIGGLSTLTRKAVVTCMRDYANGLETRLGDYAKNGNGQQPDATCGVIDDLFDLRPNQDNSLDYGGNVLVSPPVLVQTPGLGEGDSGPDVDAHDEAPYGKIILGDGGSYDAGGGARSPTPEFAEFLEAQRVQPVVRVNTAWLEVGHIDEILSFVPAAQTCARTGAGQPRGHNGARWCALLASMDLAYLLLEASYSDTVRNMRNPADPDNFTSLPTFLADNAANAFLNQFTTRGDGRLNRASHEAQRVLDDVGLRIRQALGLHEHEIILMPGLFSPTAGFDYDAVLPDTVNLLVLNNHQVVVPKPWGPRLARADAGATIDSVCREMGIRTVAPLSGLLPGLAAWLNRERIWRQWNPYQNTWLAQERQRLATHFGVPLNNVQPARQGHVNGWVEFNIDHPDSVDIFEAYIAARFAGIGLTPHFVDDWAQCHKNCGEVHCGTNERRQPTVVPAHQQWWKLLDDDP